MASLDTKDLSNIEICIGDINVIVNKDNFLKESNVFRNINISNKIVLLKTDLLYNDNMNVGFLREQKYWEIFMKLIENPDNFNTVILQYIHVINVIKTLPNLTKKTQKKLLINVYKMNIFIYIGMLSYKYDFKKIYNKCMNSIITIAMFPTDYNKYIFITPAIMTNPFINHKVYINLIRITKNYKLFYHYMESNNIIHNVNNDLQLYFQKNDLLDNTMNNMLNVFVNNN